MHWSLKAVRRKSFCLKTDNRYRSTWNFTKQLHRSTCPKVKAPDVSSVTCEESCLMWPLHRECKIILGLITCSLHRSLWNDTTEYTLLKNIYSILWWSKMNKFDRYHSALLGIIPYRSPRQQESTELIFLQYFLHNAFLNCRETYFQ